jgi:hypothetical protein
LSEAEHATPLVTDTNYPEREKTNPPHERGE